MAEEAPSIPPGRIPAGFLEALCHTYADLLRRQRTAASPLVRWNQPSRRSLEFVWLGGPFTREQILFEDKPLAVGPGHGLFDAVHKVYGTARLNPYEREVLYGYPYVIGRLRGKPIRGPLLTIGVEIDATGGDLRILPADEVVRFNSLPFRTDADSEAKDQALARIMEATPALPLTAESLRSFAAVVEREIPGLRLAGRLDGTLVAPPPEPDAHDTLTVIDQAALFVAPKTNYFLHSDLAQIAAGTAAVATATLEPLLVGAGEEQQVDFTNEQIDSAELYFPFSSNRAQRRVALLVEDPTTNVIRVEGPPGTGKSHTIANLAAHLAATGKRVLITSQKDKALEVVDDKLAGLGLAEIPMTLLRHERDSKRELLTRLDRAADKRRPTLEVQEQYRRVRKDVADEAAAKLRDAADFAEATAWEDTIERRHREKQAARGLRRFGTAIGFWFLKRKARRRAPRTTDELAEALSAKRKELLDLALGVLQLGAELTVAAAKRSERQVVRELQDVLKRDQKAHRNFSLFDRLKEQKEHAERLLRILPVWILSPDDVARLFPCAPGLFDVVIVDEASQVDLPSVLPVAYRGAKLAIFGDTKQMQSQRFAFMSRNVALEAWKQFGMDRFDPDQRLHPVSQSLLNLAALRAEEESLLDEHFRSLPPIIDFSNRRWYDQKLRIMTDARRKKFGPAAQPIVALHHVTNGVITNESQENEEEARALVDFLALIVKDPEYAGASIGVLCLFEEQVDVVHELVTQRIEPDEWIEHDLVIVNPDGFQGDERDVILYSLSWDAKVMPRAALSARQADYPHVQGMLNVAFTRARDEIHVFHSAPLDSFGMAGGQSGALGDWIAHCKAVQERSEAPPPQQPIENEFEAEVAAALRAQSVTVLRQYPACGFRIDLVAELGDNRVAVECDGTLYRKEEQGELALDDAERQAILERAGWRVLRVPYRRWLENPEGQIAKILAVLRPPEEPPTMRLPERDPSEEKPPEALFRVTKDQRALIEAVRSGSKTEEDVLRVARIILGHSRLGSRIKTKLLHAAQALNHEGLLVVEDGEYFLTAAGRGAVLAPAPEQRSRSLRRRRFR